MTVTNQTERPDKFIGYPNDTLFGIIDEPDRAQEALRALVAAGFAADTQVFYGQKGADRIDASGAKHGRLTQLRRLHQRTTLERDHAEQYERAVIGGSCVIAVHTGDPLERERARRFMKDHGGHFINYYGRFGIRGLDQ